jgi:hypothetical protein
MAFSRSVWVLMLASCGGITAEQPQNPSNVPSNKELERSNVSLRAIGFQFGGGVNTTDAKGNPVCDGLEVVKKEWAGSAFIVRSDGTLLTNFHVAGRALAMEAKFDSGAKFPVSFIKAYNSELDLAVLGLAANQQFDPVRIGDSDQVQRLDSVLAVGNPLDTGLNFTEGKVSQIVKDDEGRGVVIRHTAAITAGNSGGALYRGSEVVGVNSSVLINVGQTGFGEAVAINVAKHLLAAQGSKKLTDVFVPSFQNLSTKCHPEKATSFVIPRSAGGKPGIWKGDTDLAQLSDYIVIAEGPEDTPLDLMILEGGGREMKLAGCGRDVVALSTEYDKRMRIAVFNSAARPVNVGLTICKIIW